MKRLLLISLAAGLFAAPPPDLLVHSVPARAAVIPASDGRSVTLAFANLSR